jgi:hypothetical protein
MRLTNGHRGCGRAPAAAYRGPSLQGNAKRAWADATRTLGQTDAPCQCLGRRVNRVKARRRFARESSEEAILILWDGHDRRADAYAAEEIFDVFIVHADAAVGGGGADRTPHACGRAVDGNFRTSKGNCRRPHGIVRRSARNDMSELRVIPAHDPGRLPSGADIFPLHVGFAEPGHSGAADRDRITDGGAGPGGKVEPTLALFDDDRAVRIVLRKGYKLTRLRFSSCCQDSRAGGEGNAELHFGYDRRKTYALSCTTEEVLIFASTVH